MDARIEQQCHGYKSGHQLLSSSVRLDRLDQDIVDRLSDLSGPLRPRESFDPYLTSYPLPSGSFYVIAKTWPDLDAPRAGCVLTRSFLVPMSDWETLEFPASLIQLLVPVDKHESAVHSISFRSRPVLLPRVASNRVSALVEALFLESRKSIVLFDEPESTAIATRLLSAFWPAKRRVFTLCTLALSPRTLSGNPFDLMFAPRNARSRFSDWEGRIVEEGFSHEKGPERHRWTAVTVKHIFEDDPPSLLSLDALGILRSEDGANESDLRLSLLWNELLEKAESSPTAVLGLLDILNSRGRSSVDDFQRLEPLIAQGIALSQQSMPALDAMRFLLTLIGKFPDRRLPIGMIDNVRAAFSALAQVDPKAAVALLLDRSLGNQTHNPIVTSAIGDGLASVSNDGEPLSIISSLQADNNLRLLAYSRSWAKKIMRATEVTSPDVWTPTLVNALEYPDAELRAKSRGNVVPFLKIPAHAALLEAVLREAGNEVLFSVAEEVRDTTHFSIPEFDEPLRRATRGIEAMLGLRRLILASEANSDSDRFLLATIRPDSSDIEWLVKESGISEGRRSSLLNTLLSSALERDIQAMTQVESLSEKIEESLLPALPTTGIQLARILKFGNVPIDRLLRNGCRVLPYVDGKLKSDLSLRMLTIGFATANASDNAHLEALISELTPSFDSHRLVALATPSTATQQRVGDNIILLDRANSKIRNRVLAEIEELSDRLIQRRNNSISKELAAAWAHLLSDSGSINRRAQIRAAGAVLSFALSEWDKPVSPLIVGAFPIVYAELSAGHEAPGLFSFFFADWDRCKTARKNIVHAFLGAKWPAVDLIRAVAPTGDSDRVFLQLLNERDGEPFLRRLLNDVSELPPDERLRIEKAINKVLNGPGTKDRKN